jgi:hypothetical protein
MKKRHFLRTRALKLPAIVTALLALSLTLFAPLVSAQETKVYLEQDIEDWLIGEVAGATVGITNGTVSLDSGVGDLNYVQVNGVTLDMLGVSVGLNPAKFKFDGSTLVNVIVELNLFGVAPAPKILGTATVACDGRRNARSNRSHWNQGRGLRARSDSGVISTQSLMSSTRLS